MPPIQVTFSFVHDVFQCTKLFHRYQLIWYSQQPCAVGRVDIIIPRREIRKQGQGHKWLSKWGRRVLAGVQGFCLNPAVIPLHQIASSLVSNLAIHLDSSSFRMNLSKWLHLTLESIVNFILESESDDQCTCDLRCKYLPFKSKWLTHKGGYLLALIFLLL